MNGERRLTTNEDNDEKQYDIPNGAYAMPDGLGIGVALKLH